MNLSNELISQFAKLTAGEKETNKENTVYGTVVEFNGTKYVKLDGSDQLTPVTSTTRINEDDRVTVMIKNHTATVTGNISSPSATGAEVDTLGENIKVFDTVLADKVSTKDLQANNAEIENLYAKKAEMNELVANTAVVGELKAVNVEVDGKLKAVDAEIQDLTSSNVTITGKLSANEASISKLEAKDAEIETLVAGKADVKDLTVINADIGTLKAKDAEIETLVADKADIKDLTAINADIGTLTADVGDINTLIFGSATGSSIQTSFANAVVAQLGNAQIKSAMIKDISADKITAGDISTNNVRVVSDDGKLIISDETIQISDDNRVRVQIGKDASNDYSVNVWDADGNLMFSKGGITDAAIKDAIIRDDMVEDDANISASKLNISSLFKEINDAAETIKSTKIFLDDKNQTLDVAFGTMTTEVEGVKSSVSSQGTQISAVQGQISSKIWQQDIDTTVDNLEIGGRNLLPKSILPSFVTTDEGKSGFGWFKAEGSNGVTPIQTINNALSLTPGQSYTVSFITWADTSHDMKVDLYPDTLPEKRIIVSTEPRKYIWTFKSDSDDIKTCRLRFFNDLGDKLWHNTWITDVKLEQGTKSTDWTPAPEDVDSELQTLSTQYSSLDQTVDSISATVAKHTSDISGVSSQMSDMKIDLEGFKTTVSETYVTNTEFDNLEIGGRNLVRDSAMTKDTEYWSFAGGLCSYTFNKGYCEIYRTAVSSGRAFNNQTSNVNPLLKPEDLAGGTYTLSAEIKKLDGYNITDGSTLHYRCYTTDLSSSYQQLSIPLGGATVEWKKVSKTFTFGNYDFDGVGEVVLALETAENTGVCIRNIKLEKGDKATDWTPAPEDMNKEITELSTKYSSLDQTVDSISATVASHTSDISGVSDRVTNVVANLDGFKSTVSDTYATKTNMALLSGDPTNYSQLNDSTASHWEFTHDNTADGHWYTANPIKRDKFVSDYYECVGGEKIKIEFEISTSCKAKIKTGDTTTAFAGTAIGIYSYDDTPATVGIGYSTRITGSDAAPVTAVSSTITVPSTARRFRVFLQTEAASDFSGTIKIRKLIVSRVNAMGDRLTKAETSITQNTNEIELRATKTEVDNTLGNYYTKAETESAINVSANGIVSQVGATYATKSDLSTTNTNVSKAQSDIDNLEFGGRNLFESSGTLTEGMTSSHSCPNRTFSTGSDNRVPSGQYLAITMTADTSATYNGGPYLTGAGHKWGSKMIVGEEYTVSVWVKCSTAKDVGKIEAEFLSDRVYVSRPNLSTEWQKYIVTGIYNGNTTSSAAITFYYGSKWIDGDVFYLSSPKIEKGNKATDWTPAPEDITADIDTAKDEAVAHTDSELSEVKTIVQQLRDSVATLIQDEDGNSLMVQDSTSSTWSFSTRSLESALAALESGLADTNDSISGEGGVNSQLSSIRKDLDSMVDYVKIGTYNGQPCIELGESDNGFKLRITNTEIQFADGTVIPAYISNKKLMIEIAEVKKELQFDGFVWKKRVNSASGLHHLGLQWKGVIS